MNIERDRTIALTESKGFRPEHTIKAAGAQITRHPASKKEPLVSYIRRYPIQLELYPVANTVEANPDAGI